MPTNKNALNRYIIIDSCLSRRNRIWTFKDLLNEVRGKNNTGATVSIRTLRGDLEAMRSSTHYNAPIEFTRLKGYHYTDSNFSIFKSSLTSEDLLLLHQSLHTLKGLRGFGLADDLNELIQRLERHVPSEVSSAAPILQLEVAPDYIGTTYLKPLYIAIRDKTPLVIHYQPYRATRVNQIEVHPQLLKTYNGRWYLIALNESKGVHPQNYALDRIKQLSACPLEFRSADSNFGNYFDSLIGVTIPEKSIGVEPIRLYITAGRAPFVSTKPLHKSQHVISDTDDGMEVELHLIINQELKTLLLSFGPDLQVISPPALRKSMRKLIKKSYSHYE